MKKKIIVAVVVVVLILAAIAIISVLAQTPAMSRRQAIRLWRMPGRKRMLIMKLFVCLYFPVIPGCILKMSRRRSSPGYMCVR